MKNNKEFISLLKKFTRWLKANPGVSPKNAGPEDYPFELKGKDCPIEFWKTIYPEDKGGEEPQLMNITETENKLLTEYRQEFIAWLKIQQ